MTIDFCLTSDSPFVEFIGAMGCGKSTIYKELSRRSSDSDLRWLLTKGRFIEERYAQVVGCRHMRLFYLLTRLLFLRSVRLRFLKSELRALGLSKLNDLNIEALINVALFQRENYEGKAVHAAARLQYFFNTLYETSAIRALIDRDNEVVVLDEGIMQRCLSLLFRLKDCDGFVENYCKSVVNPPLLLIHVETDRGLAMKRLEKRKVDRDVHIELFDVAVEMSRKIVQHMHARGVEILRLDGASDPVLNADSCVDKIRGVAKKLHRK